MEDRLLTIRELAEYLRVNPFTVYRWVAQKRIPHLRVGRTLRFRLDDINEFMRERGHKKPDGQ
jgi:excisionase family DNA binding protein